MNLHFQKKGRGGYLPDKSRNRAYLTVDSLDDFGFKLLFYLTVFDANGG